MTSAVAGNNIHAGRDPVQSLVLKARARRRRADLCIDGGVTAQPDSQLSSERRLARGVVLVLILAALFVIALVVSLTLRSAWWKESPAPYDRGATAPAAQSRHASV